MKENSQKENLRDKFNAAGRKQRGRPPGSQNKNPHLEGLNEEDQEELEKIIQYNRICSGIVEAKDKKPSEEKPTLALKNTFSDDEDNKKINRYFYDSFASFTAFEQEIAWDIIDADKLLVPVWNLSNAFELVDIASLKIQIRNHIKAIKLEGEEKINRTYSESIVRCENAIKIKKEAIGIDPKNINKTGGSMSETFLECVEKIRADKKNSILTEEKQIDELKRLVTGKLDIEEIKKELEKWYGQFIKEFRPKSISSFKPIFGYWMRKTEEEKLRESQFDDADENSLERFLAHAEAD